MEHPVTLPAAKAEKSIFNILPDMPAGPLDLYRKKASFDWKKLKVAIEGQEAIRFQVLS